MTKIDLSATVSYLSRDTHRYLFYSYFLYGLWLNFTQNLDQQRILVISNKNETLFLLKLSYSKKHLFQPKLK